MEGVLQGALNGSLQDPSHSRSKQQQGERPWRPDFYNHKQINSWHNAPSLGEELTRIRTKDAELCVPNATNKVLNALQAFPDRASLFLLIKSCGTQKDLHKGNSIHADVLARGLLVKDVSLANALITMYAKCGALAKAQDLFDELAVKNVVSWNALISAYVQNGHSDEALRSFEGMRNEGFSPDSVTFTCALKACSSVGEAEKGEEIHAEVRRQGLIEKDRLLGTALVDMYAKCGALAKAQGVFDKLPVLDAITWTALISGYVQHGLGNEALHCYGEMREKGFSPDRVTFLCILKACGIIGALEKGEAIHDELSRQGLLEKNDALRTALVDMYVKCGALVKAQMVFDKFPTQDVIAWNALLAGYVQHRMGDEALSCFEQMRDKGVSPDVVTFSCILKACGSTGSLETGQEIHEEVNQQGLLEKDIMLGTALVDMYAKCGELAKAQDVFNKLPAHGVDTWTALIAGYSQVGKVEAVFKSFLKMREEEVEPDEVTFVVLLTACSHAGLVEEAQMYFDSMSSIYCIIPTLEHRTCMVDIFSRAGLFNKAVSVIEKVPPSEYYLLWLALMGASRKWVNVELGKWVFEHAIQLNEKSTAAYVCMSNIYAAAGMQEDVYKVEALRMRNGAWEMPVRCWWTDINKHVHSFTVGDNSHFKSKCIHSKLKDIERKLQLGGYSSYWLSNPISSAKNEDAPCGHMEKLVIASALSNTLEGTPIRVTKNMRVCSDCHFSISLISKVEKRKIQVIDANGIHIFEDGKCFCAGHS